MPVNVIQLDPRDISKNDLASRYEHRNFFNVFGAEGCLLQCERLKVWQLSQSVRNNSFSSKSKLHRLHSICNYYPIAQYRHSAAAGCESCLVWLQILENVFQHPPVERKKNSTVVSEYLIRPDFLLCERLVDGDQVLKERSVQLFYPNGSRLLFRCMPSSSFLLDKEKAVARLTTWIQECGSKHSQCVLSAPTVLPARLLDVKAINEEGVKGIRLVETKAGQPYRYIALSHRWGTATMSTRNTTKTIHLLKTFKACHSLPGNFRRAIAIVRELGVDYIWIDSMCIIQEGDDGRDWIAESAKMADIYRGAYLTIVMAWDDDNDHDLFTKSGIDTRDCCLKITDQGRDTYTIGVRDNDRRIGEKGYRKTDLQEFQNHSSIFGRGWIFQERLLSPRVVTCHREEFTFQCLQKSMCECMNPQMAPHPRDTNARHFILSNRIHRQFLAMGSSPGGPIDPGVSMGNSQIRWREIVTEYMSLNLTYQTDILPAIAGCARAFNQSRNLQYAAGLWEETISRDIMWYNDGPHIKGRSESWTAPTWSWASLKAGQKITFCSVTFADHNYTEHLTNRNIEKIFVDACHDRFGRIKAARLTVEVFLFPCEIRHFCTPQGRAHRRLRHDLNYERSYTNVSCGVQNNFLNFYEAVVSTYFDRWFRGTEMGFSPMTGCQRGCGLATVHLMRLIERPTGWKTSGLVNWLMMLKRLDEKEEIYERIGVVVLTWSNSENCRKWFEDIWSSKAQLKRIIVV